MINGVENVLISYISKVSEDETVQNEFGEHPLNTHTIYTCV